jgi:predicted SPOUT superfamily RNA methylase MTH1
MKTKMTIVTTATFLFLSLSHQGEASQTAIQTYNNPKYLGYSLDWCKTFARDCGKPAADMFCQKEGHLNALDFAKKKSTVETITVQNHAICNPQHHGCDSFSHIKCKQKIIKPTLFPKPTYRGYRLDWCYEFGNKCGKPAADAFCQSKGFSMAHSFEIDAAVKSQTMIPSNNAICNPDIRHCDSFKIIQCK